MKKAFVLVLLVSAGLFFLLRRGSQAGDTNFQMKEAIGPVMACDDGGEASEEEWKLTSLAAKFEKLNAKDREPGEPDSETIDQAEPLTAKLAKVSRLIENSDHEEAVKISAALNKFIEQ